MKILAFSAYYYPEVAASMYLSTNLYESLANAGLRVELYTPIPCRGINGVLRREYSNVSREVLCNGNLVIHRMWIPYEKKNVILRAFRYLFMNFKFIVIGLRSNADLIFVQSTPPTQGAMAAIIAKVNGIPLVYNLQDVFPESLVNAGITSQGSFVWKIGRIIENFSYKNARKIITISDGWGRSLLEKKVPEEKIEVVYNWVDENNVFPVNKEDNKVLKKYNLKITDFYVTHCGNMGMSQNLDTVLDAAKDIWQTNTDIKFVFVGEGACKKELQDRVIRESISNVLFIPFQDEKDLAHVMSMGDISIVSSKKHVGLSSLPSKTWNILSAGRPVLCAFDKGSDLQKIIEKNQLGICIEPDDSKAFKESVLNAYAHQDMLKKFGENGRNFVEKNLTKEVGTKKYLDIITSCIDN